MSTNLSIYLRDARPIAEIAQAIGRALDLGEPRPDGDQAWLGDFYVAPNEPLLLELAYYTHVIDVPNVYDDESAMRAGLVELHSRVVAAGFTSALAGIEGEGYDIAGEHVWVPEAKALLPLERELNALVRGRALTREAFEAVAVRARVVAGERTDILEAWIETWDRAAGAPGLGID